MSYLLPAIFLSSASGFMPELGMFTVLNEAQQNCGNHLCSGKELSSTLSGWFCPAYTATNPATHQRVFCNYEGNWIYYNAAPSDCEFRSKQYCVDPGNNCWNTPSSDCDYWCTCTNYESSTANRLGTQFGTLASTSGSDEQPRLGHSQRDQCPPYLPQAQSQLSPGSLGVVCWNKGQFCRYPSFGMNFVCSDYNGVWQLQGAAPTPRPTSPVQDTCPGYWFIWSGLTRCDRYGRICRYPSWGKNYVCDNGFWQSQGPAPTPRPTPAPTNPATCPPSASYIRPGSFCTQKGQICSYSDPLLKKKTEGHMDHEAYECSDNGSWRQLQL